MAISNKRDSHCIWFKHLPRVIAETLAKLKPEQQVKFLINGTEISWFRMKNGTDGRMTDGIRVGPGMSKEIWEGIPLRADFEIDFCDTAFTNKDGNKGCRSMAPRTQKGKNRGTSVGTRTLPRKCNKFFFDGYLFADYSGAFDSVQQRRSIKVAYATGSGNPEVLNFPFTRERLLSEFIERLGSATKTGMRLVLGQDHQYSIPYALAKQIGLELDWRKALKGLVRGTYGAGSPALDHAKYFATNFNQWLRSRGMSPYFFSATKSVDYGIPDTDPRGRRDQTVYRLCEQYPSVFGTGKPKSFNRVGDNGSVGGQTLVGLIKLFELMEMCEQERIPLRCWPFDGVDITSATYEGYHLLIEPYPSAAGHRRAIRTDENDAITAARLICEADRNGTLVKLLDLSCLSAQDQEMVRFEGWIAGHLPFLGRG